MVQPEKDQAPVGAVLVVGGGISGMQASLDLANAGFRVYLAEENTAIGGKMSQLDKTFPTNDCSMCIISPKLVETGRHRNIQILTGARLESVSGAPGRFTAGLTRRPRHIRLDKCTGCGECATVCPVEVPDEFNLKMGRRRAVYKLYAQAIPGAFAIEKRDRGPCVQTCPAGTAVQGYLNLIRAGRYQEAVQLILERLPLPGVLGRVCPAPCESRCRRAEIDAPVAIRDLKRFAADQIDWTTFALPPVSPKPARDRVAVVGSGPAGLSCAFFLVRQGYRVTVFEALPVLGGLLRTGIPEFRLPREVLDRELEFLRRTGVEFLTSTPVGPERTVDHLLSDGYRAVFLATGAWESLKLGIEGEDLAGVLPGLDLLRRRALGQAVSTGDRVAVIGGGNVALDAARTALRLGASTVTVLYRRTRAEMPANAREIEEARAEGVAFEYLTAPVRVLGRGGRVCGLECQRMELGEPDQSGRRRPVPRPGSEYRMEVDTLIPAIGQRSDFSRLECAPGIGFDGQGRAEADSLTLQTRRPEVFCGGDLFSGPATVVEAVATGRQAAISIDRFLRGENLRAGREEKPSGEDWAPIPRDRQPAERAHLPELDPRERAGSFAECLQGFSGEQARGEADRCINCGVCCECKLCVSACKAEAVEHQPPGEISESLEVGSVILAPGFEPSDPRLRDEFGYGRYPNVVTSLEFERMLSASGPSEGHVRRPSDGSEPRRIAWIQCVGSRDHACNRDWCSSVCCMYATKQAVIAREHDARIEPTIFFIDLRAFGKGFDDYVTRAREHHAVRFIRSMPSRVFEDPVSGSLELRYVDESGRQAADEFDLVVLSVGLQVSAETRELAGRLGVDLDEFGFARVDSFQPLQSSRPGIFVSGVFAGPKDIPETVSQASGAAGAAASLLAASRGTLAVTEEIPPERPLPEGTEPRIGVFVCHCGINIAAIVDVEETTEYARGLPGVVWADHLLYTCSQDNQEKIRQIILEQGLNRVVVASCSPRTHEPLFQQTLSQAGLNKYLFDMANIRDQCSWVHRRDNRRATEKAKRLLKMAVANVSRAQPLEEREFAVEPSLLIVGGGLAGMTAALQAARQGFGVYLVEKEAQLGGTLRNLRRTDQGEKVGDLLERLEKEIRDFEKIRLFLSAQVVEHRGYVGNFETEVMVPPGAGRTIRHGALLVATGGRENRPSLYGLDQHQRVMTQTDFERWLDDGREAGVEPPHLVMIQCVGSRDEHRPYCSRVCCNQAIKNAMAFKQRFPRSRVDILYRDIRSYGTAEARYQAARRAGVNFVRYDPASNPPRVETSGEKPRIALNDPSLGRPLELVPDLLVLSVGIVPSQADDLAAMLRVPQADTGFFIEAHAKLRPVDFASEGLFLAGLAHGPKSIPETISQASAAVARAATILSKPRLRTSGVVSSVNPDLCAVCLTCVRACPYGVPVVTGEHTAQINPALCQGCGICAAECPARAIVLGNYRDEQLWAKLESLKPVKGATGA